MEPDGIKTKPEATEPTVRQSMSKPRKYLVFVLLAIMGVGHGYCVLSNEEHWPFSRYPMYSVVHRDTWTDEFLVGTLRDDPTKQVPVSYFVYDRPISVKVSLDHLTRAMDEDPSKAEDLRLAMLGLGEIYLDQRGGHRPNDFQDISSLSLIKVSYKAVRNDGPIRAEEIDRQVVMQVELPSTTLMTAGEAGG